MEILDFIFHFDKHLMYVVEHYGYWTYLLLFLVIFCETGLVVLPFLPGDSLLFIVGAFSAVGSFQPVVVAGTLIAAAIIGDSVNYAVGRYSGRKLIDGKQPRWINKQHLDKTHHFFKKYGGKTIILARFIPIIRSFAPFVAGFIHMDYPKFILYNIVGGVLWVTSFMTVGFCFGNIPLVKDNLSVVMLAIIFVSVLPAVIEFIRHRISLQRPL